VCKGLTKGTIVAESAGTIGYHTGESPDDRSQAVCKENGIDISGQRARQISRADWTRFNVIAALDSSVLADLEEMCPANATAKLVLFNPPNGIPDPYYGRVDGFRSMLQTISAAIEPFLREHGLI
jgi:protein-tyrosine phosphatase